MGIHDHIKYLKHGYSKVLDHVCREIRHGRISRNYGLKLVNFYSQQEPKHTELLLEWLGIKKTSFQYVIEKHAKYGTKNKSNSTITESLDISKTNKLGFNSSSSINYDYEEEQYVLFGKGYP